MRKLVTNTFVSFDGIMQAPGGPEEDPTGNFKSGGWSVNYWDDLMGKVMDEFSAKPFDLLLGRKTYEIFAAHWPYSKEEPMAMKLSSTGVIMTIYKLAGELKTGTFALAKSSDAELKRREKIAKEG